MSNLSNSKGSRRSGSGAHGRNKPPAATPPAKTSKRASATAAGCHRRARPEMTIELCVRACDRMADGQSLRSVCRAPGMPAKSTFLRFVAENALAAEMYERAVEARADAHFEEILAIADDPKLKTADQIRRAKLRIEARQWTIQRMHPQKYSERLHLRHGGDQDAPPIKTEAEHQFAIGLADVYDRVGALFAAGRAMAPIGRPKSEEQGDAVPDAPAPEPEPDQTALPAGSRIEKGKLVIPL